MVKNWLIRTQANQILGPVSKEKIKEFIEKGSLAPDDEICSGNGYWFSVKEKDLVEKFLIFGETQPFNPIAEAKDILTVGLDTPELSEKEMDSIRLPDQLDLEYPGQGPSQASGNIPSGASHGSGGEKKPQNPMAQHSQSPLNLPSDSDLEYPDMGDSKKKAL